MEIYHSDKEYKNSVFYERLVSTIIAVLSSGFNFFCIHGKLWEAHSWYGIMLVWTIPIMILSIVAFFCYKRAADEVRELCLEHGYYESREGDGFLVVPEDIFEFLNVAMAAVFYGRLIDSDNSVESEV